MVVLLAGLSIGAGMAADVPLPEPESQPVAVSSDRFNGFYVGADIGLALDRVATDHTLFGDALVANGFLNLAGQPCDNVAVCTTSFDDSASRFTWGAFAGANVRMDDFVLGVEASASSGSGNEVVSEFDSVNQFGTDTIDIASAIDWTATLRGRAGVVMNDTILAYATAGLAVGAVSASVERVCDGCIVGTSSSSAEQTAYGWTAGAGIEVAMDDNWTLRGQYLYLDLGDLEQSTAADNSFPETEIVSHFSTQQITVGLSYSF